MKCKFCKHYEIAGHRGGYCELLGSLMDGRQASCPLAVPAFCEAPTAAIPPDNTDTARDIIWELERALCLAISLEHV